MEFPGVSYGFPMGFLWFSYGFLWFSCGFPIGFDRFTSCESSLFFRTTSCRTCSSSPHRVDVTRSPVWSLRCFTWSSCAFWLGPVPGLRGLKMLGGLLGSLLVCGVWKWDDPSYNRTWLRTCSMDLYGFEYGLCSHLMTRRGIFVGCSIFRQTHV